MPFAPTKASNSFFWCVHPTHDCNSTLEYLNAYAARTSDFDGARLTTKFDMVKDSIFSISTTLETTLSGKHKFFYKLLLAYSHYQSFCVCVCVYVCSFQLYAGLLNSTVFHNSRAYNWDGLAVGTVNAFRKFSHLCSESVHSLWIFVNSIHRQHCCCE